MSEDKSILISIIIPVYNVDPYLRECLDSIVNQTLHEIEIICVNDCSTDGSFAILQAYEKMDVRIKVIDKASNEGLATTRNMGISIASGKYILFVDSDDFIDKTLCQKAFTYAEKAHADLVIYDYAAFHNSKELERNRRKESSLVAIDPYDKKSLLQFQAFAWTKMIRSDIMRSLHIRFPCGLTYEDAPVHWKLITQTHQITLLPERLYFYRQRDSSICYSNDWVQADIIAVFEIVRDFLMKEGLYDEYRDQFLLDELRRFPGHYERLSPFLRPRFRKMIIEHLSVEEWLYIRDKNELRWQDRDFYLTLNGSIPAKIRRCSWLLARSFYRKLRRKMHTFIDRRTDPTKATSKEESIAL